MMMMMMPLLPPLLPLLLPLTARAPYQRHTRMDDQARINDITVKTVIGVEHSVVSKCNAYCHRRASCFELFGFDILLDQNLKPWLIEVAPVGHSPSTAQLDNTTNIAHRHTNR